jgi:hypothetical protein
VASTRQRRKVRRDVGDMDVVGGRMEGWMGGWLYRVGRVLSCRIVSYQCQKCAKASWCVVVVTRGGMLRLNAVLLVIANPFVCLHVSSCTQKYSPIPISISLSAGTGDPSFIPFTHSIQLSKCYLYTHSPDFEVDMASTRRDKIGRECQCHQSHEDR